MVVGVEHHLHAVAQLELREDPADVRGALEQAFAHDGPAVVDVVTDKMELVMPPAVKAEQAIGFSLYAARAILNGRGDELLELAKRNLFR